MNPTAIYSKSGKGVQEASGKTSLLDRGDRAVLSAIDGRANLGDVAKKVGKNFDSAFQTLINKLDKEGFIREASPGTAAAAPAAKAPAGKAAKPAAKADDGGFGDLDFSSLGGGAPKAAPAPSRPAPPPPKPAAPPPPPPKPAAPKPDPAAQAAAKAQQSALQKAREEAEAKADAERQRVKMEAEAKMRSEMEAQARDAATKKLKEEAEARIKAEADAKIRAAQEAAAKAAAEARAKADAEAKAKVEAERKAREEAERARKAAEEEARKAREEAERARKAAEEEARKAREEAERIRKAAEEEARKAREEAERVRKAAEEERKREEAERAARRKREEEEEAARRRAREEEDRRHEEERAAKRKKTEEPAPAPAKSEAAGGLDSLMADLDSFTTREDAERKEKEEAERKAQEVAARRAREDEERRVQEEAERAKKEEARARKEEEKRRKREDEEELARKREAEEKRLREEEEKRKREADERERKAKAEEVLAAKATRGPAVAVGEDTDEVRKRMLGRRGGGAAAAPSGILEPPSLRRKKSGWGKSVAIVLVVLLAAAFGLVHVMPVSTADYERAASEALGRPVKIGEAHLSLISGLQIKLKDIRLGDDVRIASGAATPEFEALRGERKVFTRIDLEGVQVPQEAIGQALLAKVKADNFAVGRVVVHKLELTGAAVLPGPLEADLVYADDGTLRSATLRGPDTLLARITPTANNIEYVVTASGFPLPVLPEVTLSDFGMKGTANARGMSITEWGGKIYGGSISGTANVRWSGGWTIDGVVTARNINAAVFAPALLSEGKGEGTGRFSMSGAEPSKLAAGGRLEGSFTVNSGAIGIDLGRVIRTGGRESAGRTSFNELTGQGTYDRGAVSLRNVSIGSGALNAGASADVSQSGALSGRVIVDVKSTSSGRAANATLQLGGTIKEPQVKN